MKVRTYPKPQSRRSVFSSLGATFAVLAIATGCGGEAESDETDDGIEITVECSGRGELHDDHCHCDPGYTPGEDPLECVPEEGEQESHDHDHEEHDHDGEEHDEHDDDHHEEHDDEHDDDDHHEEHDEHDDDDHHEEHDEEHDEHDEEGGPEMLEFDPMAVRARTALGDDNQRVWILEAAQQDIRLILESYAAHGGPTSPGTLEITEAEANYATCGLCLRVRTGCAEHEDHFHCEQTYMPEVGSTITITELGEADEELWVGSIGCTRQKGATHAASRST